MITKAIHAYFQGLQDFYNPFQIYFDTIYCNDIEDYKKAMSSYNLRQAYSWDRLASAQITEDLLNSLRANRPGGGSYNVIQYKFSALKKTDQHPNNEFYYIIYGKNGKVQVMNQQRRFVELSRDEEIFLQKEYEDFQKKQPNSPMENTIHDTIAGDILPQVDVNDKGNIIYQRLGVYCDIDLECRFLTTNTSIFEDFQILYNAMLCDKNPPVYMELKHAPDVKYPITTRYSEIDTAERLDAEKYGNLTMIGFNVTITTMFLSSYVRRQMPINKIQVYSEIQKNKPR